MSELILYTSEDGITRVDRHTKEGELAENAVVKESLTTAADGKRYKAMHKARQGKVFLVNAGLVFEKGDPKNFIPVNNIKKFSRN